jgi:hypothetical protein
LIPKLGAGKKINIGIEYEGTLCAKICIQSVGADLSPDLAAATNSGFVTSETG